MWWSSLPAKSIIPGVPFVSWCEAARLEYTGRERTNPSQAAAAAMVMKYWEDEPSRSRPYRDSIPDVPANWKGSVDVSGSLSKVRKLVAAGIPPIVSDRKSVV